MPAIKGAGELRHRIAFLELDAERDTAGAEVGDWQEFATVWASIEPLTGRERLQADQIQAEVSHRVRCRYLAGVSPKMRIQFGERVFGIDSVMNLEERNIEFEILALEIAA